MTSPSTMGEVRRNADPLAIVNSHIRSLALSARTARRVGVPELAFARRVQIMALNDVRREILGRSA